MLLEELQARTKGLCSPAEYDAINAMYMLDESMTKEDAARIWELQYGKPRRQAIKNRNALIQRIIETADGFTYNSERPADVWQAISNAERLIREARKGNPWAVSVVDEHGIQWETREWGKTPNGCYTIYDLNVVVFGKKGATRHYVGYRFY